MYIAALFFIFLPMATININEQEKGSQVPVSENDVLEITLDEVPTSGYRWVISQLNPDHLKVLSEDYELYNGAGMGGGGIKKIQLQVLRKGIGTIQLQNKQPWSDDVDKTFEFSYC